MEPLRLNMNGSTIFLLHLNYPPDKEHQRVELLHGGSISWSLFSLTIDLLDKAASVDRQAAREGNYS